MVQRIKSVQSYLFRLFSVRTLYFNTTKDYIPIMHLVVIHHVTPISKVYWILTLCWLDFHGLYYEHTIM